MKKSLVTLLASICLILVLAGLPFMVACAKPAPTPKAEPIVLKAIEMWKIGDVQNWGFETLAERVNKKAKGELTIKIMGGPESIEVKDQITACMKGVVDIAFISPSYVESMIPEIGALSCRSMAGTLTQLEKKGIINIYDELSRKRGLYFLGVFDDWDPHMVYTKARVQTPKDLAGLKIRAFITVKPFVERLNATPVILPISEVYTAMERGTVDGFVFPFTSLTSQRLVEVTKYCIFHDVLVGNMLTVINLDSWNRLPKHLQELIVKTKLDMLDELTENRKALFDKEAKAVQAAGVKFIEFSPADTKTYRELARQLLWEDLLKKSPEVVSKLKALMPQ